MNYTTHHNLLPVCPPKMSLIVTLEDILYCMHIYFLYMHVALIYSQASSTKKKTINVCK